MERLILLLALIVLAPAPAFAGTSIYDPAVHVLNNGMRVITKERHHAKTTSIRLVVGVGHLHSSCEKQQAAHLLEHVIFAGYDDLTESDINRQFDELGTKDNAFTGMRDTTFVLDTFGPNTLDTISTLYHMVSRPALRPADIDGARRIVESEDDQEAANTRELYGDASRVRSSMHLGYRHLLSDVLENQKCISVVSKPEQVTRDDLVRIHGRYYVPNNMTLIAVGDFDSAELLIRVRETFGRLRPGEPPRPMEAMSAPQEVEPASFQGTFDFSHAHVMVRTHGYTSPDYYALKLLFDHLDNRMYDIFRIENPLAYSPEADLASEYDYGIARVGANVPEQHFDEAQELINELLQEVKGRRLDSATFETLQRKAMIENQMKLETNAAVADYYVVSLFELDKQGEFTDESVAIRSVSADDLRRVANTYFSRDRLVWIEDRSDGNGGRRAHKN